MVDIFLWEGENVKCLNIDMVFLSGPVISHLTPVNSKRTIYWQSHSWIKDVKLSSQNLKQVSVAVHWFDSRTLFTEVCALLLEWRRGPARLFLQMHLSQRRDAVILIVLGNLDWKSRGGSESSKQIHYRRGRAYRAFLHVVEMSASPRSFVK